MQCPPRLRLVRPVKALGVVDGKKHQWHAVRIPPVGSNLQHTNLSQGQQGMSTPLHIITCTLPETNSQSPLKIDPLKKEIRSLETTIFRGELLVSGKVYITYLDTKKSWRLLKAHLSPPRIWIDLLGDPKPPGFFQHKGTTQQCTEYWWKKSWTTTWHVWNRCKLWDILPYPLVQDFFHQQ